MRSFCFSSKRHHVQTKTEKFESPWIALEPVLSENGRWGHTQPLMWRYSYRLGRGKLGSPVHNSRISKMVSVTRLCSGIIKTKWSRSSKVVLQLEKMIRPCKELTSPWIRHVSITTALYHNSHKLCHGTTSTDCTNADVLAKTHRSLWERRQLAAWDSMPSQPRLSQNEAK